ncbi:MAG: hypothetical protein KGI98_14925 [Euryarchaeota archaeon]|nr:hypothetical protein [Euryarchaeota archaeon]MDE1879461.1 hypothetical protein [Euryarchaeota archaeon]
MGRATLTEKTARKTYPCSAGGSPIKAGDRYWNLSAFRLMARYCSEHKPSDEQVRHFAPQSRADRASEVADSLRGAAEELNAIKDEVERALQENDDDDSLTDDQQAELTALKGRVEAIGPDLSDLESLAEELRSWADNMDSGNLGHTSKYDEVESAASELEDIDTNVDLPSAPEDMTREAWSQFADECEEAAGELEDRASEIENVSFPGMY